MLIANTLAVPADRIFALPAHELSASVAWFGAACYALQIYFDFSGYSDMAIGLGRMFGFRIPENFNYPYVAASITEFWRRWHISLSTWFRDYLYIPLGGNRRGVGRTYLNLIVVFLLCGLWHGASWTFVVWGLFHGGFLILERLGLGRALRSASAPVAHGYCLLTVTVGWVFFRAETLTHAVGYLSAMVGHERHRGSCALHRRLRRRRDPGRFPRGAARLDTVARWREPANSLRLRHGGLHGGNRCGSDRLRRQAGQSDLQPVHLLPVLVRWIPRPPSFTASSAAGTSCMRRCSWSSSCFRGSE